MNGDGFGPQVVPVLAARLGVDWDQLEQYRVDMGARTAGTVQLLASWQWQVTRFEVEATKSLTDRTAWTGADLLGGLYTRDRLQSCLDRLPAPLAERVGEVVAEVDDRFRAITAPDDGGLIKAFDPTTNPTAGGWWWRRVPTSGAIHDDLLAGGV